MKDINLNQAQKLDRPGIQPIYFLHILNVGTGSETLYFSDRCFTYNGHNYEDYLTNLPDLAQQIDQFGGYLNLNAQLQFKNQPFRSSPSLLEWFDLNPITRKLCEIYVLYIDTGETFGSDVSIKLAKLGIGEFKDISRRGFSAELCTMLHLIDKREILYRIDSVDYPSADPKAIGKVANQIYGSVMDVPCHCIKTGAYSTLRSNMDSNDTMIKLSSVIYPIAFAASGNVVIDEEEIKYTTVSTNYNYLGGCTRAQNGTAAAPHKIGTPVLRVLPNYKWMIAGHICKAVDGIYVDRVKLDDAEYTLNLNDSGKTTVQFAIRHLLKHQGSHYHPISITKRVFPSSVSLSPSPIDVAWNFKGPLGNVKDKNNDSYMRLWAQGTTAPQINQSCILTINFPAYSGPKPLKIYAVILHQTLYTDSLGAYVRLAVPAQVNLTNGNQKIEQRILLSGTTVPTSIKIRWVCQNSYPDYFICGSYVFEVWLEVESSGTGASASSGVFSRMDDVFAPLITADVGGYKDDASGTYTGSANALIENQADVRHHFLRSVLGVDVGDIDTIGLATLRAIYAARISEGYKTAAVLNLISEKPSEIIKRIDYETRSQTREDGGKFRCDFHPDTIEAPVMTFSNTGDYRFLEEPVFGQTSMEAIKNKIIALYDVDWGGREVNNRYLSNFRKIKILPDATSVGKYGPLPETIEFLTCKKETMVSDVIAWILYQKKDVFKTLILVADHSARPLERNDIIGLTWYFWSGIKWQILKIRELVYRQRYEIEAIQAER